MADVSYTESNQGAQILVHKNYMYTFEATYNGTEHWRCQQLRPYCPARIHLSSGIPTVNREYIHAASLAKVIARRVKVAAKDKAASRMEPPRAIYQNIVKDVPVEAAHELGSYLAITMCVQRERRKNSIPLPNPTTLEEKETENFMDRTLSG